MARVVSAVLSLTLLACGSPGGGDGGTGGGNQTSLEPIAVGASWTYDTTDPLKDGGVQTGTKTITAEAQEAVPGKTSVTGWRLRTDVPGSQSQLTWQEETTSAIVRHRDDVFELDGGLRDSTVYAPSKLRVKIGTAETSTNATYDETYTETVTTPGAAPVTTSKTVTWKVINGAESVTVPAGTFTAVHVQKQTGTNPDKEYWFVRGVGKVKELAIGSGRLEVLRSHSP